MGFQHREPMVRCEFSVEFMVRGNFPFPENYCRQRVQSELKVTD
jgi:hypothetical protein